MPCRAIIDADAAAYAAMLMPFDAAAAAADAIAMPDELCHDAISAIS